ncbi:hypothetical protein BLX87_00025 [Bacillus sp. VT-16-64]|nr:hypothetical protein BLX87_00025 [Bacillus sp. VT-16-64]
MRVVSHKERKVKIEHYLQQLERIAQEDELTEENVSSIESKIDKYQKKKEHLTEIKKKMNEEEKNQLTTTDPESRANGEKRHLNARLVQLTFSRRNAY